MSSYKEFRSPTLARRCFASSYLARMLPAAAANDNHSLAEDSSCFTPSPLTRARAYSTCASISPASAALFAQASTLNTQHRCSSPLQPICCYASIRALVEAKPSISHALAQKELGAREQASPPRDAYKPAPWHGHHVLLPTLACYKRYRTSPANLQPLTSFCNNFARNLNPESSCQAH